MAGNHMEFEKPIVELQKKVDELKKLSADGAIDAAEEISKMEKKIRIMKKNMYKNLEPWQIVQIMRNVERPKTLDYIDSCFTDFNEMHGDRQFKDDKALVGGIARLDGVSVVVLGQQKGKDTKENIYRNFGMAQPEGYRKALRLMKFAEKFSMPVICFIDTTGAFPGLEGEERGAAEAIARNLHEMAGLRVPIIVAVIGEGGSGGALGIGVGDRILMMKYATYSVISFEGCASILWKDPSKASGAAKALRPTAKDLLEFKVIDEIISEPAEGAHMNFKKAAKNVKESLERNLKTLMEIPVEKLLEERYEKFRTMGVYKSEKNDSGKSGPLE
ncbi:MAG: acetyl-CoA carboxylase carboxyltransferase subunit alpha [Candidatus Goldiibacteriota bacterium]